MSEETARKVEEQTKEQPAETPAFWSSVGGWLGAYWMWLAGGVAAAGLGYAAYRYLGQDGEAEE